VGVVVGDERTRDRHPILLCGSDDRVRVPSGIDDEAFFPLLAADEIDEVLHVAELHLSEVQVRVLGHGVFSCAWASWGSLAAAFAPCLSRSRASRAAARSSDRRRKKMTSSTRPSVM